MEPRVTDQPGFILRRREWRNSSLLLDVFTRDYGCLRLLAKGARRATAQAHYQPFVLLGVNWSGRQELKTLTGLEGQTLPIAEENYFALLYVNELITAMTPPGEANPEVFTAYLALLQRAVRVLGEAPLRRFELEMLQSLGYFPGLSTISANGDPINPWQCYQFVINTGFIPCEDDAPDSVSGQALLDWSEGDYQQAGVLRLAKIALRSTIDFNLHGKKLKSRDVYAQLTRRK